MPDGPGRIGPHHGIAVRHSDRPSRAIRCVTIVSIWDRSFSRSSREKAFARGDRPRSHLPVGRADARSRVISVGICRGTREGSPSTSPNLVARGSRNGADCGPCGLCRVPRIGGARGIRTPDLLNAIQTLSQLSYSPVPERGA